MAAPFLTSSALLVAWGYLLVVLMAEALAGQTLQGRDTGQASCVRVTVLRGEACPWDAVACGYGGTWARSCSQGHHPSPQGPMS